MTKRQEEVLQYCMSYYMMNGYMPSSRCIGDALYMSHQTAHRHMKALETQGLVRFVNRRAVPAINPHIKVAL